MSKKNKIKRTPVTTNPSVPANPPASSTFSSSQAFNPDYSYVMKDLKRIGILAVTFIVALVAISFVI